MTAATDPVMLRATGLSRRFGTLWAIRGMDLEVLRGEVLGLLGPNGAGKTTTVRVLTALIAPSEGRATVDGLDTGSMRRRARRGSSAICASSRCGSGATTWPATSARG